MKKILMLSDAPYTLNPRAVREATSLISSGREVLLIEPENPELPDEEIVEGISIKRLFSPQIFDIKQVDYPKQLARTISAFEFDVIHCHDQVMLNIAVKIKKIRPESILIYDSHELYHSWPLNVSDRANLPIRIKSLIVRKYLVAREKRNARHIDFLITVNKSLAEILEKYFRLSTQAIVLRNIPYPEQVEQDPSLLRDKFSIKDTTKILVFIGIHVYMKTLNLETVLEQIGNKDGLAMVFICSERGDKAKLEAWLEERSIKNVYFHDFVRREDLSRYIASCDVGLIPTWNRADLSYWFALDNKLFEYINGEIPILATQQPEYKRIIDKSNNGVCVNPDEPNAYYEGFTEILNNYQKYKSNVVDSKDEYNWNKEQEILLSFYSSLEP